MNPSLGGTIQHPAEGAVAERVSGCLLPVVARHCEANAAGEGICNAVSRR